MHQSSVVRANPMTACCHIITLSSKHALAYDGGTFFIFLEKELRAVQLSIFAGSKLRGDSQWLGMERSFRLEGQNLLVHSNSELLLRFVSAANSRLLAVPVERERIN